MSSRRTRCEMNWYGFSSPLRILARSSSQYLCTGAWPLPMSRMPRCIKDPMLKWFVWVTTVSIDSQAHDAARGDTYIAHIDTRDAGAPIVPHALDHLIDDLARVCLGPQRHLQPVHPTLSVLARGALN